MLNDALDGAVLTRRIAALEDDEDLRAGMNDFPLQLREFDLQPVQTSLVVFFARLARRFAGILLTGFLHAALLDPDSLLPPANP